MNDEMPDTCDTVLFLGSGVSGKSRQARMHVERQHRNRRRRQDQESRNLRLESKFEVELSSISAATNIATGNPQDDANEPQRWGTSNALSWPPSKISDWLQPFFASPTHALQYGNSDPFNSMLVPVDATVNDLLHCSRRWYFESKWPLGLVLNQHTHHTDAWMTDTTYALCAEATFYAALALAFSYAAQFGRGSACTEDQEGAQYKIMALKAVREELHRRPNVSTTNAILDLVATEFFDGSIAESVLHLEAAHLFVNAIGGLTALDESTRDFVGLLDYVLSWTLFKKPEFQVDDWDPGPWKAQAFSQRPFDATPTGSRMNPTEMCWSILPSTHLTTALNDLREILSIRQMVENVIDNRHGDKIIRWLHIRSVAVYTRLLIHFLDDTDQLQVTSLTCSDFSGNLYAAVCLGLRYCHCLILYTPSFTMKHFPALQIYEALHTAMRQVNAPSGKYTDVVLWVYFVGAIVENLAGVQEMRDLSFQLRFQQSVKDGGLKSREAIRDVLERFSMRSL